MKTTTNFLCMLAATASIFCLLEEHAEAEIIITQVNATSVAIGQDNFELRNANKGTALFFGNSLRGQNQNTANRFVLAYGQYFQADTSPLLIYQTDSSTVAYVFDSTPSDNANPGINFSTYDVDQNGIADTLFMLDFGSNILDQSDDRILAYASETGSSFIDLNSARSELLASVEGPPIGSVHISISLDTGIELLWACTPGFAYRVEYSETLSADDWNPLGLEQVPSIGQSNMSYTDQPPVGTQKRFYRISRRKL